MNVDATTANLMHCAGQMLKMVHNARGLDNDGILQVDTFANGEIPTLPDGAKVVLMPYEEDYIQTGPGTDDRVSHAGEIIRLCVRLHFQHIVLSTTVFGISLIVCNMDTFIYDTMRIISSDQSHLFCFLSGVIWSVVVWSCLLGLVSSGSGLLWMW